MILSAKNIIKSYKVANEKVNVLNGINLELFDSEFISIMGASGAGKSTLLNILGTLDSFDSGGLQINSNIINNNEDYSTFRAYNIGFVFQFHHLLHEFSVLENLIIPQMLIKKNNINAIHNAKNLLGELDLINLENRYPSQISGGERQRIAVLRALVNQPKLILADEPTGNLDKENSVKLLELFNTIKENYKTTIVVATHDEFIKNYTNRNFKLNCGILIGN
ncbi:MAG: ABC transporter ATP-binding protein [Candidatus Marinimicrobia bacterium]|nr:ABC transporter ATP-binding protein [Candidatus Neomarinimicrobiota bacterium]